jgi:hypothetical protein
MNNSICTGLQRQARFAMIAVYFVMIALKLRNLALS